MGRTAPTTAALIFGALMLSAASGTVAADDAPGKAIFVGQNCNGCHAVPAASVGKLGDQTVTGPDLEGLGDEYKPCSLRRWLKRKKDHDGYTHLQYFNGTDEDLEFMVSWLLEQ